MSMSICSPATSRCARPWPPTAGAGTPLRLPAFGRRWGTAEMFDLARQANENPPKLEDLRRARVFAATSSSSTRPIIASWPKASRRGLHASTWRDDATPAPAPAQVLRAARFYMAAQIETGHLCPITMTRAAVARACRRRRAGRRALAEDSLARLRPALPPLVGEDRHHARHGHDREAGRHRRAHQHHARRAGRRGLSPSPATNGSCRRRCATLSWCWRRRRAGSPAF